MAANFVPQSMLYNMGYGQFPNSARDRSQEQSIGNTSVNPTKLQQGSWGAVPQFNYGFDPYQASNLGRYTPPMLKNPTSGSNEWYDNGGYSYNLPNSFGSPYSNSYNMFGPIGNYPSYQQDFQNMYNNLFGQQQQGAGQQPQIPQLQAPQANPQPQVGNTRGTVGATFLPALGAIQGGPSVSGPIMMRGG